MNKGQEKRIREAESKLNEALAIIDEVKNELEEKYDSMSERTQEGDKGQELQEHIDTLDGVYSEIENQSTELSNMVGID
jgi:uncharacterized protein YhaN